jgi:hypothetical protein
MTAEETSGSDVQGECIYAVSYPPAMYAQDILNDRDFAAAMGYGWLHDDDTDFARSFREQVKRQAEIYQQWLAKEEGNGAPDMTPEPAAEQTDD